MCSCTDRERSLRADSDATFVGNRHLRVPAVEHGDHWLAVPAHPVGDLGELAGLLALGVETQENHVGIGDGRFGAGLELCSGNGAAPPGDSRGVDEAASRHRTSRTSVVQSLSPWDIGAPLPLDSASIRLLLPAPVRPNSTKLKVSSRDRWRVNRASGVGPASCKRPANASRPPSQSGRRGRPGRAAPIHAAIEHVGDLVGEPIDEPKAFGDRRSHGFVQVRPAASTQWDLIDIVTFSARSASRTWAVDGGRWTIIKAQSLRASRPEPTGFRWPGAHFDRAISASSDAGLSPSGWLLLYGLPSSAENRPRRPAP